MAKKTQTVVNAEEKQVKATVKQKENKPHLPKVTVKKKKSVVFIGSESAPFIATGGLADVMGSLPKAIVANGNYDVSCFIPMYSQIKQEYREKFEFVTSFYVNLAWRKQYCGVFKYVYEGVNYFFIDNEYYFAREGKIYGHYDDGERFAFFSKACLDAISALNINPDIVNCNDWQTAPAIIYLKGMYYGDYKFKKIKTVFTIHNIEYQGWYGMNCYEDLFGFDGSLYSYIEFKDCINLMKAAIEMSDKVSTVSPTYAEEIKNSFYAHGLEDIIAKNSYKLCGILNGIDYDYYNPSTDTHIIKNYSADDVSGKAECKLALQKLLGLPEKSDVPIVSMITRLVSHKGVDLVKQVIEQFMTEDVQFVVLGTGDASYEDYFKYVAGLYPNKCKAVIAFNQDLSRKIYAGSDIFLMPSKMEPCGLSQMIASRYGTVSVVRETGGLNDSIKAYYDGQGNGFTFRDYNPYDMLYVLRSAVNTYKNSKVWANVVKNAMTSDFSWDYQAKKYEDLYEN
ncbi:MAG: glycogen synthase GlgA [Clostridia bacterium]|nr:glycogen synthase GlgA [Clostridia bacterium]